MMSGRVARSVGAAVFAAVVTVAAPARPVAAENLWSALAKAYQNNPQLNAQRAIVRQTDENVPQALSGYRPTISATANVGSQYTDTKAISGGQQIHLGRRNGAAAAARRPRRARSAPSQAKEPRARIVLASVSSSSSRSR